MKKYSQFICTLAIILTGCAGKENFVIYSTSDINGWLWSRQSGDSETEEIGGFAVFKNLIDRETSPKIVMDTGNWFGQTPEGYFTKGVSVIECMNAAGYELAVPGFSDTKLQDRDFENLIKSAKFPVISSNLVYRNSRKINSLLPSHIREIAGIKVGFIGITLIQPEKPDISRIYGSFKFEKPVEQVNKTARILKKNKAELLVLVMNTDWDSRLDSDFYKSFTQKLSKIDLIISDNYAGPEPLRLKNTWVAGAGKQMLTAAKIRVWAQPGTGKINKIESDEIQLNPKVYGQAPEILEIIAKYRKIASNYLDRKIGSSVQSIPITEGEQSPVGNWISDCMKDWSKSNVAILNFTEMKSGIEKGPVTVRDLYNVIPYDTTIVFIKIRGHDLLNFFEENRGKDLSVSGMKLIMEKTGRIKNFTIGGMPVSDGKIYRLSIPDSLISKKEYQILVNAVEFVNSRKYLREAVGWCVSRQKSVKKPEMDRIIIE